MAAIGVLTNISGIVQLAVIIEGQVVPLIVAAVKSVDSKVNADQTVDYTVVLTTGKDNLAASEANFMQALEAINRERAAVGDPPLTIPGASAPSGG